MWWFPVADVLDLWRSVMGNVEKPAPPVDWAEVRSRLGTALPADYRVLADNYPGLYLDGFMSVVHPVGGERTFSLQEFVEQTLEEFRLRQEDFPEEVPHPLFPEPGGLLPWGITDNNDYVFWLTTGEPDEWQVVATDTDDWWTFPGNMQKFLVGVLKREVRCPVITEQFPSENYAVVGV